MTAGAPTNVCQMTGLAKVAPLPVCLELCPVEVRLPAADASLQIEAESEDAHKATHLSRSFRAFAKPRFRWAILTTVPTCLLQQLLIALPYAANERAGGSVPVRGLVAGLAAGMFLTPIFVYSGPSLACGSPHKRGALAALFSLVVGVCVAFIPRDSATLGFTPILVVTIVLTYALGAVTVTAPLCVNTHHKALVRSAGLPLAVTLCLFGGLLICHVELTRRTSHPAVGLLLPICTFYIEVLVMVLLRRSFQTAYYAPKRAYLDSLGAAGGVILDATDSAAASELHAQSPPLVGDIELVFSSYSGMFSVCLVNAKIVAGIVEVSFTPQSTAWISSLILSLLVESMRRIGMWQRVLYRVSSVVGLQELFSVNALKISFQRSQKSCSWMAIAITLSIGCFRAASLGDVRYILWLDISKTVPTMLAANAAAELFKWALEKVCAAKKWIRFPIAAGFASDNPLRNEAIREIRLWSALDVEGAGPMCAGSYAYIFGVGGCFIYFAFTAYMGPRFVFGLDDCAYVFHDSEMLAWPMLCGKNSSHIF